MKTYIVIFLLLASVSVCNGQSISKADSLQVMAALGEVCRQFEHPDYSEFQEISTTEILCLVCEVAQSPSNGRWSYSKQRKDFFDNYLESIKNSTSWERALKSNKIVLHRQKGYGVEIIAFLMIWGKDEYALGHEGAQLGLNFLKVDGVYKFAGIETVP